MGDQIYLTLSVHYILLLHLVYSHQYPLCWNFKSLQYFCFLSRLLKGHWCCRKSISCFKHAPLQFPPMLLYLPQAFQCSSYLHLCACLQSAWLFWLCRFSVTALQGVGNLRLLLCMNWLLIKSICGLTSSKTRPLCSSLLVFKLNILIKKKIAVTCVFLF